MSNGYFLNITEEKLYYAISSIKSMAFTFSCVFYTGYCGGPPEASGRYQRKGKNCQTPLNVNVSDCAGRTSLHHAAYNGHLEVKISYFDDNKNTWLSGILIGSCIECKIKIRLYEW